MHRRHAAFHVLRHLVLIAALGSSLGASADSCRAADTLKAFRQRLGNADFSSSVCSSINAVLKRVLQGDKVGGRQLEPTKALDRQAAAQERANAARDPEFARDLKNETNGETDPLRRLVIEAALLDDTGAYQARDLLIEQISAGVRQ
jgi:hypothetical protein